jgi:hypothetical protein
MGKVNKKKYLIGGAIIGIAWTLYIIFIYSGQSDIYTHFGQ